VRTVQEDSEVGRLSTSLKRKSMKGTKDEKDAEGIEVPVHRTSTATANDLTGLPDSRSGR